MALRYKCTRRVLLSNQEKKKTVRHWHRVLPGRIYDLRYEDLVTDSETGIRQLLAACNLSFHEDCLAFHRSKRSARAPKVRQPMYTASIGRWKRYENKLSALQAILEQDPGP
jgi:hypothetical protein